MSHRRVAITGLGAVTPVGIGVKPFWRALREGRSGIDALPDLEPAAGRRPLGARVTDFDPMAFVTQPIGTMARFAQFGVAAAKMARDDAGLQAVARASRFPVCFGTGASAAPEFQQALERFAERGMRRRDASIVVGSIGHSVTSHVAVELGLTGPLMTLGSACAAGVDTIQWGWEQIRSGRTPGVVAGAADASLHPYVLAAWDALSWLAQWPGPPAEALRPFDVLGTGSVLGEGAAAFVLEDLDHAQARGARIHAEILGAGSASDGLDLRTVDPQGAALQAAVRVALAAARLDPGEVDHVNTHGAGVRQHDRAETAALRAVFGRHAYRVPVSSIKPMIGQPFAAAGALQVVAACFTLAEQFVPATLNHDIPDPECDLDYVPDRGRAARVKIALVATRAIGPTYSALLLAAPAG